MAGLHKSQSRDLGPRAWMETRRALPRSLPKVLPRNCLLLPSTDPRQNARLSYLENLFRVKDPTTPTNLLTVALLHPNRLRLNSSPAHCHSSKRKAPLLMSVCKAWLCQPLLPLPRPPRAIARTTMPSSTIPKPLSSLPTLSTAGTFRSSTSSFRLPVHSAFSECPPCPRPTP